MRGGRVAGRDAAAGTARRVDAVEEDQNVLAHAVLAHEGERLAVGAGYERAHHQYGDGVFCQVGRHKHQGEDEQPGHAAHALLAAGALERGVLVGGKHRRAYQEHEAQTVEGHLGGRGGGECGDDEAQQGVGHPGEHAHIAALDVQILADHLPHADEHARRDDRAAEGVGDAEGGHVARDPVAEGVLHEDQQAVCQVEEGCAHDIAVGLVVRGAPCGVGHRGAAQAHAHDHERVDGKELSHDRPPWVHAQGAGWEESCKLERVPLCLAHCRRLACGWCYSSPLPLYDRLPRCGFLAALCSGFNLVQGDLRRPQAPLNRCCNQLGPCRRGAQAESWARGGVPAGMRPCAPPVCDRCGREEPRR